MVFSLLTDDSSIIILCVPLALFMGKADILLTTLRALGLMPEFRCACAWLGCEHWKKLKCANGEYKKQTIIEQVGCWGPWGLFARRYHRPPFVLALSHTKKSLAFIFSREQVSAHPRGLSMYLLPAGLSGWMWRFWFPTALCMLASFGTHFWLALSLVLAQTIGMLVIVFFLFNFFSYPVLSCIWKKANWTSQFDKFFFSLFSQEMGYPDSYNRKPFRLQLLRALSPLPCMRSPHVVLGELSPNTAMLRAAIMDMLSTEFEGPAPLWCSQPVIRWGLFWLYPAWVAFILLILWVSTILWFKNPVNYYMVMSIIGCPLLYSFADSELLQPSYKFILLALGLWLICTMTFLMRMGRYLKAWLVMPPEQMRLLLPLVSAQTPQLRENAIFLEDKATSQIIIIVSALCSIIFGACVKLFL